MRLLLFILTYFLVSAAAFPQDSSELARNNNISSRNLELASALNQQHSYAFVDEIVKSINSINYTSHEFLSKELTSRFSDNRSKVRSIYTWIATNIKYDDQLIYGLTGDNQLAENVWKNRSAVCSGYTNLFNSMCKYAGVESRKIKGYVNDFSGRKLIEPNHAWNSVLIDGQWQLVDVTWASVNVESARRNGRKNHKFLLDHFFLVNPRQLIQTHLPEDPYWQLQNNHVNLETFLGGKESIDEVLSDYFNEEKNFEQLISEYEDLDSLDKTIAYLERMVSTKAHKNREYGLGVAYYYKAQDIMKQADHDLYNASKAAYRKAKFYYQKSLDSLSMLEKNDFGYDFSRQLADNVTFRMNALQ